MNFLKEEKINRIIQDCLMIILGILMCVFVDATKSTITVIAAIFMFAFAILCFSIFFVTFIIHDPMFLLRGVLFVLGGCFILAYQDLFLNVIAVVIAVSLLTQGISHFCLSLDLYKIKDKKWWIDLIFSLIMVVAGIGLFIIDIVDGGASSLLMIYGGVSIIITAIMNLVLICCLHREYKKIKSIYNNL